MTNPVSPVVSPLKTDVGIAGSRQSASYELRRSLPLKNCEYCEELPFVNGKRPKPRLTSWVFRVKLPSGHWSNVWWRVCWEHMTPVMKQVVEEMYL